MAQSFHAGMLTKMLLAEHDEDTREEAFIAALLHNLGESAFGSLAARWPKSWMQCWRNHLPHNTMNWCENPAPVFNKLSIGLASSWRMCVTDRLTSGSRPSNTRGALHRSSQPIQRPDHGSTNDPGPTFQQGLSVLAKVMGQDVGMVKTGCQTVQP